MRNLLIVFVFALVYQHCIFGQSLEIGLDNSVIQVEEVDYLIDAEGTLDINTVALSNDFVRNDGSFEFDKNVGVYWIKFDLVNNSTEDQSYLVDFQNWSYADLYFQNAENSYERRSTGHLLAYTERDYPTANHAYIKLDLEPGEKQQYFGRLNPAPNNVLVPVDLSFSIGSRDHFDKKDNRSKSLTFFFVGIYLVMLLYNLFVYTATGDKVFRFYLISLVILIINVMDTSGVIFDLLPNFDGLPFFLDKWHITEPHLLTIFLLLYANDFLKIQERYPKWFKWLRIDVYAVIIMAVIILINFDIGMPLIVMNTLPFVAIMFTVALKSLRAKYPGALYFFLGHIFWFLGGIGTMLGQLKLLPFADFFVYHAFPVGSSIEMILYSLALANTINYLRRENEQKQARIIAQLEENQKLQTKVNRELEEKVAERTLEITRQNEKISKQAKTLEEEKERSERLLLNILPQEVATELKVTGHATPKYYENVSIVFVDITEFSRMARNMSPNDIVQDLDYIFSAFDMIIEKNGMEKIKTIGDAYMAVAGLPVPNETHPRDAVKAALEMFEFINNWKEGQHSLGKDGINLRIGINSGSVTAGVVGKSKFQFDIWGDAVNLASRMETGGEPGKVNVSQSTYELIKDEFNCTHRGKMDVKNMGELDMYFVEGRA
jgi:class 3 adenylate cyclase